jgi:hypothetical protein
MAQASRGAPARGDAGYDGVESFAGEPVTLQRRGVGAVAAPDGGPPNSFRLSEGGSAPRTGWLALLPWRASA